MHKDVKTKLYQSLLNRHLVLKQQIKHLSKGEKKAFSRKILIGAEELLLRWDEMGKDYSKPIAVLLNEVESILETNTKG